MADAAAPAPELKEYPEFPGQKLSKRYVLRFLLSFVVVHRCHHHHHHHHPRFGFLHIRRNTHLLLLSHIQKHTQNFSEYKKMLKRQKADEEKAAKAAAKVKAIIQKLLRALSTNSKMRALKPFFVFFSFFKKLSSFSSLRPMIKTSNLFFFCFAPYGCRKCCCCWKEEVLT